MRAIAHVASRARGEPVARDLPVTLNFHPDRRVNGATVLEQLAREGIYRSQFETRISNGALSAHPGGNRWRWESRIFGAAYDAAPAGLRPKYGALNFRRDPAGGARRFGSAHLRLRPEVLERTTFCYPDSTFEPEHFGVAARMELIPLALAEARDALDDYIEAHVHGVVRLDRDVEALVLDPCFRGTEIETPAAGLPCAVEWHPGFRLHVDELRRHADYRGEAIVALGISLASDGFLDARIVGEARRAGRHEEQPLKQLWHCIARFGSPG